MTVSTRGNWWVVLTAVLGALLLTMGAFSAVVVGSGDDSVGPILGALGGFASGGLVIGGLARRRSDVIAGSRLIVVGAALTLGGLESIPLGVLVLISGFWTGNLQLSATQDEPELHPVGAQQIEMTSHWYAWLGGAAALFAVGWIPLIIEGDDLTWGWPIWVLGWLGAIVTGAVGLILLALRFVVRHRTRLV